MVESDNIQEKTEQPTQKRLEDAREHGQVARSAELNTALMVTAGISILLLFGQSLAGRFLDLTRSLFVLPRSGFAQHDALFAALRDALVQGISIFSVLIVVLFVLALVTPLLLGGWLFSIRALLPRAGRLDPFVGLKRIFGVQGLMELLKALAKFSLLALILFLFMAANLDVLYALGGEDVRRAIARGVSLLLWSGLALCIALAIIAAADVPCQIWSHRQNLKMTRQELRDELKQTEGDPENRARRKAVQRRIFRRRHRGD